MKSPGLTLILYGWASTHAGCKEMGSRVSMTSESSGIVTAVQGCVASLHRPFIFPRKPPTWDNLHPLSCLQSPVSVPEIV